MVDGIRFDNVARSVFAATSRRGLLHGLRGAALGTLVPSLPLSTSAKKKKKTKVKKNAFGCVNVNGKCAGKDGNCCSGICQGKKSKKGKKAKKDKSSCLAHNTGTCIVGSTTCEVGAEIPCNQANPACLCVKTTGEAAFCGNLEAGVPALCSVCTKDTDCEPAFGEGAACVVLDGVCSPLCALTGTTACVPPCA